ncbi:DUF1161 domain-containing protein [Rhodanobacter sp. C05]|uniref:DUF1161 domain-containing protein n=1 Tax=Rhodanobacter sp. C05 TaxID=1945855 RepID=UPI00098525D6|nr:DUF1161 domain-containing protein [Rhodanobacter sp. C05]OOG41392.1 hypothetical protein B0E51_06725 [Rhodanobacter sp. C05]
MNKCFGIAVLLLALPMMAHASCDAVKSSIDAKIKANGVSGYTLDVVSADQADAGGSVVGQCEGSKKIVYTRGSADKSDNTAPADASSAPTNTSKWHHAMKKPATQVDKSDTPSQPASAASSGG